MPFVSARMLNPAIATLAGLLLLCAINPGLAGDTNNPAPSTGSGRALRQAQGGAPKEPAVASHWSFQPLGDAVAPPVRNPRWVRTDLDRFVLAQLEQAGHEPQLEADARTWLRRVSFDLTGLPPTPEEMDGFLQDGSSAARARAVERLLGSAQYGEQWGRHWLDLARYADTAGDSADYPIPQAHKYRDYVIAAFNKDKPYGQFLREQIAGDLLPSETTEQWREQTIATGFIAVARRFGVDPGGTQHLTIEDTLDTLGRAVLGLSLSCARCHDHKHDPIGMEEYYGLYGIFASTQYPHAGSEVMRYQTNFVPLIPWEDVAKLGRPYLEKLAVVDAELARLENEMTAREDHPKELQALKTAYEKLWGERDDMVLDAPRIDAAYAVQEGTSSDARIQERGDPARLGKKVARGFLRVLGGHALPADGQGSGRLELADWLTDAAAPLTARVMANRIWQHHFGGALVATPSDFGSKGRPPEDPALLEYLAGRFIESGGSVKQMHRLIVLSASYAQQAVPRSRERGAWAPVRRRLSAEEVRDALLAVSGELDLHPGGEHPFPHPSKWNYTQHFQFSGVYPSRKRSVYLMQQRLKKHPFLALFDGPDPNVSQAERGESITPLQALFVMNDPLAHSLAGKFAVRLLRERATDAERIDWACQLAFGRRARREDLREGLAYLAHATATLDPSMAATDRLGEAWASYARALLGSNEFFFVE